MDVGEAVPKKRAILLALVFVAVAGAGCVQTPEDLQSGDVGESEDRTQWGEPHFQPDGDAMAAVAKGRPIHVSAHGFSVGTGPDEVAVSFAGASDVAHVLGDAKTATRTNYFVGAPDEWRTDVPNYRVAVLQDLYPGISVRFYFTPEHDLEFDVELDATAATEEVRFTVSTPVHVDAGGALRSHDGSAFLLPPQTFTEDGQALTSRFVSLEEGYGFEVDDRPDDHGTIIDPVVVLGSTLFGPGTVGEDIIQGSTMLTGAPGVIHVTGTTEGGSVFPLMTTYGPLGNKDAFVAQLDTTLAVTWTSVIGGSNDDEGTDVMFHPGIGFPEVVMVGNTQSANIPDDFFLGLLGGSQDAFVARFDPGSGALTCSYKHQFFGAGGHDSATAIVPHMHHPGFAIAGTSDGPGLTDSSTPGQQITHGGGTDAFLTGIMDHDPACGVIPDVFCSTYFGAAGDEAGWDLADFDGHDLGLTGSTNSAPSTLPVAPAPLNIHGATPGGLEAFAVHYDPNCFVMEAALIRGPGDDVGYAIDLDPARGFHVAGETSSTTGFHLTAPTQPLYGGGVSDAFVTLLDFNMATSLFSTYLGGADLDSARDVVGLSTGDHLAVTGWTDSTAPGCPILCPPTTSFPTTAGSLTPGGGRDAFLGVIDHTTSTVSWMTLAGGNGDDESHTLARDPHTGAGGFPSDPFHIGGRTSSTLATFPGGGSSAGGDDPFVLTLQCPTGTAPC